MVPNVYPQSDVWLAFRELALNVQGLHDAQVDFTVDEVVRRRVLHDLLRAGAPKRVALRLADEAMKTGAVEGPLGTFLRVEDVRPEVIAALEEARTWHAVNPWWGRVRPVRPADRARARYPVRRDAKRKG